MLKVFAVYDQAVKQYLRPFQMNTLAEATRGWIDVVNDPKTDFHKHPADYTLFHIAEYDESTGMFRNLDCPEVVGSALKFRQEISPVKAAK